MQATTRNLMAALLSPTNRKADLAVMTAAPERTTPDARAMGITGLVGAYETFYGGVANRIHNVQLVARLIDDHYIAPARSSRSTTRPASAPRTRASSRRP